MSRDLEVERELEVLRGTIRRKDSALAAAAEEMADIRARHIEQWKTIVLAHGAGKCIPASRCQSIETVHCGLRPDALERRETVGGTHVERSINDFVRACEVLLAVEVEKACPDTALVAVLCDAVRMTREFTKGRGLPADQIARPWFE